LGSKPKPYLLSKCFLTSGTWSQPYIGHFKCDHEERLIKLAIDYIKRLSENVKKTSHFHFPETKTITIVFLQCFKSDNYKSSLFFLQVPWLSFGLFETIIKWLRHFAIFGLFWMLMKIVYFKACFEKSEQNLQYYMKF